MLNKADTERHYRRVARIAAQLAREDEALGGGRTIKELSTDAVNLAAAARRARIAVEAGKSTRAAFAVARDVLKDYHAEPVERGDVGGMGVRFSNGRHERSGADHLFYLS